MRKKNIFLINWNYDETRKINCNLMCFIKMWAATAEEKNALKRIFLSAEKVFPF